MPKITRSRTASSITRRRFHDEFDHHRSTATEQNTDQTADGPGPSIATDNPNRGPEQRMLQKPDSQKKKEKRPAAITSSAADQASTSSHHDSQKKKGKRRRATTSDFNHQTLSCLGCGDIGHVARLCDNPEVAIYHLLNVCEDCIRSHSFSSAERTVITTITPCPFHLPRLLNSKSDPANPATIQEAQFLVDKVLQLQSATGGDTEDALQWLGITEEEYKSAQDIVDFQ